MSSPQHPPDRPAGRSEITLLGPYDWDGELDGLSTLLAADADRAADGRPAPPTAADPPDDPPPVPVVDGYQVVGEVARGGMGRILKAWDRRIGRWVALKVLLAVHKDVPGMADRLLSEARLTGRLQHPGVPAVYGIGHLPDGRPYFAMRFVDGRTLADQLADRPSPAHDRPYFLGVFERVCQAVAYAHAHGVLHRDLKPANVMTAEYGVVKVLDWGFAKVLGGAAEPGSPADRPVVVGTPGYMSPEQAGGAAEDLDERCDVFGLGAILCAVLTGQPPFRAPCPRTTLLKAARAELAEAFARLDDCPADPPLVGLAKRCLAAHPDDRPADAAALAREFTGYLASVLRTAERDLMRFFDLSPDLFCVVGFDGRFRRTSANFPRLLGYASADMAHRRFLDFVHPDDLAATQGEVDAVLAGHPSDGFRNRFRRADGRYRWLEWKSRTCPDERVILAVARDLAAADDVPPRPPASGRLAPPPAADGSSQQLV